jgi:DNA-directed RNA polymerase subunit N (RpoN/RPB10)|tara:strand:+ start:1772 stop:2026 length:255 start_codon:yes stop_codon:yes gene_type:complete
MIPIRCFTCGNVLGDKWIPYVNELQVLKNESKDKMDTLELSYMDVNLPEQEKSIEGKLLDEMKIHKYCCRRMMLSNVHLISYIS